MPHKLQMENDKGGKKNERKMFYVNLKGSR